MQLHLAFYGTAPSNETYNQWLVSQQASGAYALATTVANQFAATSNAALAATVLTNLGISAATTNSAAFAALSEALVQIFDTYPEHRGVVVLNLVNILEGLVGNATYGNAATTFNNRTEVAYAAATAQVQSGVTFYSELSNPLMLSFSSSRGQRSTVYGKKSSTGGAESVDGFIFGDPAAPSSHTSLNEDGRPYVVSLSEGTTLKFDWQSARQAAVVVMLKDEPYPIVVPINLEQPSGAALQTMSSPAPGWPRTDALGTPRAGEYGTVNSTLTASVTTSGAPEAGASVWATVTSRKFKESYSLPLSEKSAGRYFAEFVNSSSAVPPRAIENACKSIVGTSKTTCEVLGPVATAMVGGGCVVLSAAVSAAATPALGAAVLLSCESVFADALAACAYMNVVPEEAIPNACRAIETSVAWFDPDGADISVTVTKGSRNASVTRYVPSNETSVEFALALPPLPPPSDRECRADETPQFRQFLYETTPPTEPHFDPLWPSVSVYALWTCTSPNFPRTLDVSLRRLYRIPYSDQTRLDEVIHRPMSRPALGSVKELFYGLQLPPGEFGLLLSSELSMTLQTPAGVIREFKRWEGGN